MAIQHLVAETHAVAGVRLPMDDIQGDILIGLQKDYERFLFFVIADGPSFKSALNNAVSLNLVTSAQHVRQREEQLAHLKAAGGKIRLSLPGMNIGLSTQGVGKVLGNGNYATGVSGFDTSFVAGAGSRSSFLGDDTTQWPEEFSTDGVDGVMLITGESRTEVDAHTAGLTALFGPSIHVIPVADDGDRGETRSGNRGHEHFGFLDGVSQPGIRTVTAQENPNDANQGVPGQDLIYPGEFVFGHPAQVPATPDKNEPPVSKDTQGVPKFMAFPWMENGSFMVWRRLQQDVEGFHAEVSAEAARLDMDPALLSARIVGRWPSGAPVVVAPLQDNPVLADDRLRNNDFEYERDDPDQRRCPYAAHIRKTYPRDDLNKFFVDQSGIPAKAESGEASVQTKRIRRAGIPYGPELEEGQDETQKRGLMFVCYQTSIENQFEFIQASWANEPAFVVGKEYPGGGQVTPGLDLIIGQNGTRDMDEPFPNYPAGHHRGRSSVFAQFVTATAAGYFFMPSLTALKTALGTN
jgi:Dyp-type peroxidase family